MEEIFDFETALHSFEQEIHDPQISKELNEEKIKFIRKQLADPKYNYVFLILAEELELKSI